MSGRIGHIASDLVKPRPIRMFHPVCEQDRHGKAPVQPNRIGRSGKGFPQVIVDLDQDATGHPQGLQGLPVLQVHIRGQCPQCESTREEQALPLFNCATRQ